jgi:hypothetical protein
MLAAEEHGASPEATTMLRLLAYEDNAMGCGDWHHSSAILVTSHEQYQSLDSRRPVEIVEDGLDLGDDVSAGRCNLLECFFDSVGHQPS